MTTATGLPDELKIGTLVFTRVPKKDNEWEVLKWEGLRLKQNEDGTVEVAFNRLRETCQSMEEVEATVGALLGGLSDGLRHLIDTSRARHNAEKGRRLDS